MRADRLLSLLMLLQTRGRLTAQELAQLLEVSERTIYRDLDALSSAGIPVYAERGPGGGISLVDGYQTRLTGLTRPEAQALFLLSMAGPLADLGLDRAINDALLKLSASLPSSQREDAQHLRQRIHMDTTWWYYSRETLPYLAMLQEAVCHDRTILLHYLDEYESNTQHLLNPYGLVSKAGIWFLVAAHATTGELHIFRVSRIQSVEISEASFVRPSDFDLATTWRDYCLSLEAQHPQLARSARAIPGEARPPVERGFIGASPTDQHPTIHRRVAHPKASATKKRALPQRYQKNAPSPNYRQPYQKKQFRCPPVGNQPQLIKKKQKWAAANKKKKIFPLKNQPFCTIPSTRRLLPGFFYGKVRQSLLAKRSAC